MTEPLVITSRTDWSPELIAQVYKEIETIAYEELDLEGKVYPNQLEVITSEQMLDAYASIGLPVHYHHWSFGKDFLRNAQSYETGRQGLAYEIVINSSPCISYLMEDNSMMMQALVIAHAAFGHNAVFHNNETFKQWTNASSIVDYMIFARDYIRMCEDRYGPAAVEEILDAAHALAPHGVDKYKRKHRPRLSEEQRLKMLIERDDQRQRELDIILKKTSFRDLDNDYVVEHDEEEENLLYYIMKNSPVLEQWQREILRIVYKVNQYFYPQTQTKVLNEGYASFVHYYIMTRLEEKGILSSDAFLAFIQSHAGVLYQPEYDKRWFSGLNPYYLGFTILMDLKRMCENPTDEDREWFPHLMGRRWQEVVQEAAFEHRDDSFIMQHLSPAVIRKLKLFAVNIDYSLFDDQRATAAGERSSPAFVSEIHDDAGYRNIRTILARTYERINHVPIIKVVGADMAGDRTLLLKYEEYRDRKLAHHDAQAVVEYIDMLWGYPVQLDLGDD